MSTSRTTGHGPAVAGPKVAGQPASGPPASGPPAVARASGAAPPAGPRHHFGLSFHHHDAPTRDAERGAAHPATGPAAGAVPADRRSGAGRGGGAGGRRPGPRVYRRRRLVALAVALAVVALAVWAGLAGVRAVTGLFASAPTDYPGPGGGSAVVVVHSGDSLTSIAQALTSAGVVRTPGAFTAAASRTPQATSIQPGYYRLTKQIPGAQAVTALLDPASRVDHRVTVPEGTTARGVGALLEAKAAIPHGQVDTLVANPAGLTVPAACGGHVEGCLFPATYDFAPDTTAAKALQAMLDRFGTSATGSDLAAKAVTVGQTPYGAVIVASIIEAESKFPEEYPKVARVVYNRLAQGMPLGMDSTINYVLPARKAHLSSADLAVDSPYNTYQVKGLPPTAIGNPGDAAIQAALAPAAGSWLYFVTIDTAGHNAFSSTYSQFLKDKATSQKVLGYQ